MAALEAHAPAAGTTGPDPRIAHHDERGHAGRDAALVERDIARVVGGHVEAGAGHAEANQTRGRAEAAIELLEGLAAGARVDVQPVAQDHVGVPALRLERVVVERAHLLGGRGPAHPQVEDGPRAHLPEVGGHLLFRHVPRLGTEDPFLLRQLLWRLEGVAAARPPVRVHVEDAHGSR